MTPQHEAEITFLKHLLQATAENIIVWRIVEDDENDKFEAVIDGELLIIEIMYLALPEGSVRCMAELSGFKTLLTFAVGTEGYAIIMEMLSENIQGWTEGKEGASKSLLRASNRISSLLGLQAQQGTPADAKKRRG